jgi:hypothetical protein
MPILPLGFLPQIPESKLDSAAQAKLNASGGSSNANVIAITTLSGLQAATANKILSIQGAIDLATGTVVLPAGVILKADGGSITNGTLTSNATSKIDGDLLHYTLTVNGGRLVGDIYILDKVKAGFTEGVVSDAIALTNKTRFNKIIKQVRDLKGREFIVNKLDAFFDVSSNTTNGTYAVIGGSSVGIPSIIGGYPIALQAETHYKFSEEVFFRVQPTNSFGAKLFVALRAHNTTVSGGNFIGDRATHDYSPVNDAQGFPRDTHEYGSNLDIIGCHNFTLENAYLANGHGDGIGVVITLLRHNGLTGGANGEVRAGEEETRNLMIRNTHVYSCRRNNISIVDAIGVVLENCIIEDAGANFPLDVSPEINGYTAGGVLPRCGLDIEPYRERNGTTGVEYLYEITRNIRITNTRFIGNYTTDLTLFKGERVFVNNNEFENTLNVNFGKENHIVGNTFILNPNLPITVEDRSAINVNSATVNDEGITRDIVLGNTIVDNTIKNFVVGMRLKSTHLKADNNKIYDFSKFGVNVSELINSEITNTKIRSSISNAVGITATFGSTLRNVKFENSIVEVPNGKAVFFDFINQSLTTEYTYLINNVFKASIPIQLKTANRFKIIGNYTDNRNFGENVTNTSFVRNYNETNSPSWFSFQLSNSNIDFIENDVYGTGATDPILYIFGNFTLSAYLNNNFRLAGNVFRKTAGTGDLVTIIGHAENTTNFSLIDNLFIKSSAQNDMTLTAKDSRFYNNYNLNGLMKYSLTNSPVNLQFSNATPIVRITSGTVISLQNQNPTIYYSEATPSSAATFTLETVKSFGGKAIVYVNKTGAPTITGATLSTGKGVAFVNATTMKMIVYSDDGINTRFYFENL